MSSNRDSTMPNNPDNARDKNDNYPEISGQASFNNILQFANAPSLQFQNLQATPNLLLMQSQQYLQQQQQHHHQQQPPASMQGVDASQLAALGLTSNPPTALAQLQQILMLEQLEQLQQQQLQLQHNAAVAGMNGQQLHQVQQHYPSTNQELAGGGSMMPTGSDPAQLAAISSTSCVSGVATGSESVTGTIGKSGNRVKAQFPESLHRILSTPQFRDVISWLPHGRSWKVLKPEAFEETIIPLFFQHGKYTSFMRQVNGWGFRRMTKGPDHNSYYHKLFLRGLPQQCAKMKRPPKSKPSETKDTVIPDFYKLSETHPLPEIDGTKPAASLHSDAAEIQASAEESSQIKCVDGTMPEPELQQIRKAENPKNCEENSNVIMASTNDDTYKSFDASVDDGADNFLEERAQEKG